MIIHVSYKLTDNPLVWGGEYYIEEHIGALTIRRYTFFLGVHSPLFNCRYWKQMGEDGDFLR